ncbi:MAG: mechanosensitive ion channel family protein [Acidobacteria bacterium]|nr:mechanosensitive ion channel family protein [Acidobacteriota bacterium]
MDYFSNSMRFLSERATEFGLKILGAIAIWFVGNWLIKIAVKLTERAMGNQKVDKTIIGYVGSAMTITLKILLVVSILRLFGFETTTFAALLAALGLAIGLAWSGMLSNVAAGAFLMILRPFKAGDVVSAGGVTGKVEEVGPFVTIINSSGVRTYVNNGKILNDNIQNYSANPYRKVDCSVQLDHTTDHNAAIDLIRKRVAEIPNVLPQPPIEIGIASFTPLGPVLEVKPCCAPQHHGQVHYDTNRAIREAFADAGFQVPRQHYTIRNLRGEGEKEMKVSA